MAVAQPRQREVWWATLDPVVGSEIAKPRPVLVLSADAVNRSPLGLCIVAAITTTPQDPGVRIQLPAAVGEPQRVSYVLPYQVRTISHDRLRERIAIVSGEVLAEVVRRLGLMISLRS